MSKSDVIETEGEVVEVLRNANFKVKLTNGFIITAYISGKLYLNNIKNMELFPQFPVYKGSISGRLPL